MNLSVENLSRKAKRRILFAVDLVVVAVALYFAFALRFETLFPYFALTKAWPLFPLMIGAAAVIVPWVGLHKVKLNSFDTNALMRTGITSAALIVAAMSLSYLLDLWAPRSVPIIFGALFFLGSVSARVLGLQMLLLLGEPRASKTAVAIYGAGSAGGQLAAALRQSREVRPVAFVDDDARLQGVIIAGLPVYAPSRLAQMARENRIERVLLAMPTISPAKRAELLRKLDGLPCEVQVLPSYVELIEGKDIVESLRPVRADDLLGRDKVDLDLPGLTEIYQGKSVLISGAGGSIGSELCRQVILCRPARLVLFDHCEFALFSVDRELRELAQEHEVELIPVLGSVCDRSTVERALTGHNVQIALHAAAYKHVPLVEQNELAGLRNNVIGTAVIAEVARRAELERFILVSTDKAVRPANIMGASKRLAELVVQDLATRSGKTLFSMVRFGNVLGSSGSVIPLFHEQISKGGPVTLTHDGVTRYFMTTSEAARLVLLAGGFARGGDVFVLDMGKPVRIRDLARRMIELSGMTVRDADNPDGDIEIATIGLRPGEKLYEELLVGEDMLTTPHPKILRAKEGMLSEFEMANVVKSLRAAIDANEPAQAREIVLRWVDGYAPPAGQAV